MRPDLAIQMMSDLFWTGLMICAPVLLLTLAVGAVSYTHLDVYKRQTVE